jgi:IS5 family transposase
LLTLRMAFRLPLRQAEGFTRSLFSLMDLDLEVPDHTTLSRRAGTLAIAPLRIPAGEPLLLILDSTGLSITGEGQWAAAKHGERGARGWRKLHFAVDGRGQILHHELTSSGGDDAHEGVRAIEAVRGDLAYVVADSAYDTQAIYDAAEGRGARTVIPPTKNASLAKARSPSRRSALQAIAAMGRSWWKARSGYTQQARVENAVGRYKAILGDRMRARGLEAQRVEVAIGVRMLNRMRAYCPPESVAIGR